MSVTARASSWNTEVKVVAAAGGTEAVSVAARASCWNTAVQVDERAADKEAVNAADGRDARCERAQQLRSSGKMQ